MPVLQACQPHPLPQHAAPAPAPHRPKCAPPPTTPPHAPPLPAASSRAAATHIGLSTPTACIWPPQVPSGGSPAAHSGLLAQPGAGPHQARAWSGRIGGGGAARTPAAARRPMRHHRRSPQASTLQLRSQPAVIAMACGRQPPLGPPAPAAQGTIAYDSNTREGARPCRDQTAGRRCTSPSGLSVCTCKHNQPTHTDPCNPCVCTRTHTRGWRATHVPTSTNECSSMTPGMVPLQTLPCQRPR